MKKRFFVVLALLCLICCVMCACESKKEISADQAVSVVLENLGDDAKNVDQPHVHAGTYKNETCYSVYVTINEESWVYIVSTDGKILSKGLSNHSH